MWMVDPKIMCQKHLCGEHVECHMMVGAIEAEIAVTGYATNNLMELDSLQMRHDRLAAEMTSRGYNHKSPLLVNEDLLAVLPERYFVRVDVDASLRDLLSRCEKCRKRFEEFTQVHKTACVLEFS